MYRRAILIDFLTGLRAGELWALKFDKLDFERGTVRIDLNVSDDGGRISNKWPKTCRPRTLRLDVVTLDLFREQLKEFPTDTGFVFSTMEGCQVRHRNFKEDYYCPAIERLGALLPAGFRFHDLRHSHASVLIQRGARIEQVKDRLGHGSIRTTIDWYGHLFDGHDDLLLHDLAEMAEDIRPAPIPEIPTAPAFPPSRVLRAS